MALLSVSYHWLADNDSTDTLTFAIAVLSHLSESCSQYQVTDRANLLDLCSNSKNLRPKPELIDAGLRCHPQDGPSSNVAGHLHSNLANVQGLQPGLNLLQEVRMPLHTAATRPGYPKA